MVSMVVVYKQKTLTFYGEAFVVNEVKDQDLPSIDYRARTGYDAVLTSAEQTNLANAIQSYRLSLYYSFHHSTLNINYH
jgi:hypothetical protein